LLTIKGIDIGSLPSICYNAIESLAVVLL